MTINKRTADGWHGYVPNKSQTRCDTCGAPLWVNPGGDKYCDAVHPQLATEKR